MFFVNVPFGAVIVAAALKIMPTVPRRAGTRLDIPGAIVLFLGLLCLIGPLLFGHDVHWSAGVWLVTAAGVAIIAGLVRLERTVARGGGMPLIDLALLSDRAFMRGLVAVFFFFFANLSFYLIMTMFMQKGLRIPPLQAGLAFVPLALTFIVASRHSGARAKHRGTLVLIEGCALQIAGLAALVMTVALAAPPSVLVLATVLMVFGLWSRACDGTIVERSALNREAFKRGRGLRDVRYYYADRQCGRGGGDRRGVFRDRSSRIGAAGAICGMRVVCAVDHHLRRIPVMDAARECMIAR